MTAFIARSPREHPSRASAGGDRTASTAQGAALAATAAFAGGGLLTQTVVVPTWQGMDPRAFLPHFRTYGPRTGATLLPIEIAATALLARTTLRSVRQHSPTRATWSLATASMLGTLMLLPLHFVRANRAMLDPDFPPQDVPAELRAWRSWNWTRTGLAVLATGLSGAALTADRHTVEVAE